MTQHHASLIPPPVANPNAGLSSVPRSGVSADALTEAAWWLDVASPTYDDLRNIGKVRQSPKV